MCGRFTRYHSWSDIHGMYRLLDPVDIGRNDIELRYNIAPTQQVPFITHGRAPGEHRVRIGQWWLVPDWATADERKYPTFNARSEDADTKSSFRSSFKSKRCLIPADGFYEWTKPSKSERDPWHIFMPGHAPFSFAGLWAYNHKLDLTSCTILTAVAQQPMQQLHDRQPIILDPAYYDQWLDPTTPVADAKEILKHDIDAELQFYRVDRQVNASVTADKQINDGNPGLIAPLAATT